MGKNTWYLNDPASGPRRVDANTFNDSFTGVVITFKPGPDFQPGKKSYRFSRFCLNGSKVMRAA